MRRQPGHLWRHADFRRFWIGDTVSLLGAQVTLIALPLTALTVLRAGPEGVGALRAAEYLPALALTLPAGPWIGRRPGRPLLIAANLGRAALLAAACALGALHALSMPLLCALILGAGALTMAFELAYQAYLPALVGPEHLTEGNSKLLATQSIGEIAGPGLGGVLVQALGAPGALAANAISFAVSSSYLARIETPERRPPGDPTPDLRAEIAGGFRILLRHPYLRAFMADAATTNLCWTVFQTAWLVYMTTALRCGAAVLGLVLAAGSIGALLGALLAQPVARTIGVGRTILLGTALDAALLAIPVAGASKRAAIAVSAAALFVNGVGWILRDVHIFSLRATLTPAPAFARMYATYRWICWGVIPIGALGGGWLATHAGLRATLFVGADGCALSWLWILCSPVARLRDHPTEASDGEAATAPPAEDERLAS